MKILATPAWMGLGDSDHGLDIILGSWRVDGWLAGARVSGYRPALLSTMCYSATRSDQCVHDSFQTNPNQRTPAPTPGWHEGMEKETPLGMVPRGATGLEVQGGDFPGVSKGDEPSGSHSDGGTRLSGGATDNWVHPSGFVCPPATWQASPAKTKGTKLSNLPRTTGSPVVSTLRSTGVEGRSSRGLDAACNM